MSALKSSFVSRFLCCCHTAVAAATSNYSFQSFSRYVFAGVSLLYLLCVDVPMVLGLPIFVLFSVWLCSSFSVIWVGIGFVLLGVWRSKSGGFRWAVSPVCFKARYSTLRLPTPTCIVHDSDFESVPRNVFWGPKACYLGTSLLLLPVHSPRA